ncbi:MAG: hypothetical protein RBR68_06845 [Tenuifilaceae bacterium]|jgi:hypothetical protein|nr:hypothetical protein [Tenuifilaceae bacterium]
MNPSSSSFILKKSFVRLSLVLLLFLCFSRLSVGQKFTKFEDDPQKYTSKLEEIIKDQLLDEEKQPFKNFVLFWNNDSISFSVEQKTRIIDVSNALLKKTIVNTTHFVSLAKILSLYPKVEKFQDIFDPWIEGLSLIVNDDKVSIAKIGRFTENSYLLFTKNILVVNPAFSWKASNNNITLHLTDNFYIDFPDINLTCFNNIDSIVIQSTAGRFFPLEDKWVGKGGKVTWTRSNFPENEIFATLSNYTINLTRNEYDADSVLFTNLDYFQKPALGRIKDKITRVSKPEMVVYPEFYTYTQRHKIKDLFEGVDFDGGYYMMGSQFVGRGTRENPAIIEIKRNKKDFLRVEAITYIFRRQTLMSNNAQIRFKLESDSLFHTGLNFTYNDGDRLVTVSPTDFLTTQSPILSSYHNFSINFGQIRWKIESDELTFGAPIGSSLGRAFFESNNYFNEEGFDLLMGRDEQHPLFAVANFTRKIQSKSFNVDEFSSFMRKSVEQTRIEIMRLAMHGYVFYEFETGSVQTLPKLYDAIRARGRFIDYDVLKFSSTTEGSPNAILNLNTLEMAIKGVENVSVSDSQNVFIYPARRELILKKDRNFAFDGVVVAGLFTFSGEDFNFDYANFSLQLNSIVSLNLDYQTNDYDLYGKRVLKKVASTIENITGEILIDKPNNKSGLQINEDYPIFKSSKNSFVYYDEKTIHNGIYKRDNFFFEIYPFIFKNINNFELKDISFNGMFYSADILGPIEDTLILRPDNSLGFRRESPSSGYAVYEGRGRFFNRIDLSNQGLRGMGDLAYITAKVTSDNIYFFPDSMRAVSTNFSMQQQIAGIQFPQVQGGEHLVKWFPFKEQLFAYKGKKPFSMFDMQAKLTGDLILQPLGLVGDGLMDMDKARLRSEKYDFNAIDFHSNIANVEFDVVNTTELALNANKMKVWIDFESRKGIFNKIDNSLLANLPPMMYRSYLDMFTWGIDENELTISTPSKQQAVDMQEFYVSGMADKDTIPSGAIFYSYHIEEDSLYFVSSKAKYNLANPSIKADSVNYIIIADAIINPKDKKLEIDAKQRFIPLNGSIINANYTERFHTIYNAKISIPSRKKYFASGTIDYVDENDSIQPVFLKDIKVDDQGNTFASGTLTQPDNFKLSPRFGFIGSFEVFAKENFWLFNGGAKPLYNCPQLKSSNVSFKARLEPKNIYIPVAESPQNLNMVNLISSSIVTVDSTHLYPGLLIDRKEYSDKALVNAYGFIHYDKNKNRFMLGSKEKINNPDSTGNLISLATDFCVLFSEGRVNLPINLGQINHFSTGTLSHNLKDSILNMDVVLALKFHFNTLALDAMANEIREKSGLLNVDLNRKIYSKYLYERLEPGEAQTGMNQIRLFGAMTQIPISMESTITFSELRMRWDPINKSFVSNGKLGIGTIGNIQVNKKVDGFIEIYKRNTGDWMIIYLELEPDKYYVFNYARGSMQVSSHNTLFNEPINKMRARERRVKVKAGEIPFNFVVGTRRELQRARDRYYEITGKIATESEVNQDSQEDSETESSAIEEGNENNDAINNNAEEDKEDSVIQVQ